MFQYRSLTRRLSCSVYSLRQTTPRHCSTRATTFLRRGRPRSGHRYTAAAAAAAAAASAAASAALAGGLAVAMVGSLERGPDEVRCDSASSPAEVRADTTAMSLERRELRRLALAYLTESFHATDASDRENTRSKQEAEKGEHREGSTVALAAALLRQDIGDDGEDEVLPPNVYDVDKILSETPLLRTNNAFHDTLNNDDAIRCPYVLNRPDQEGEGIEAVVRFGHSIAGHPKIVHGGVTALTFDNLFGMALFLQKTGAVVTAYLKVDYKAPLPCLTTAVVDITIDREEGRKLFVTGRLKSLDGTVTFSTAEALFIKPRTAPEWGEVESGSPRPS